MQDPHSLDPISPLGPLTSNVIPPPTTMPSATVMSAAPAHLTVDQILYPYVIIFCVSFVVAIIVTPIMRHIAFWAGVIDRPDGARKMHREPVAYLGGVAIFVAWFCGVACSQFVHWHDSTLWDLWKGHHPDKIDVSLPIVFGAVTTFCLGLWDDIKGLRPLKKVFGQAAAAILLFYSGVGRFLTRPFIWALIDRLNRSAGQWVHISQQVSDALVFLTSFCLVVAIVVFCCNASNLMDGLDGLCGGVTAIIAMGFLALAVVLAQSPHLGGVGIPDWAEMGSAVNMDALRVVMALALLGAAMGFVPHNFNPASIFMGDAGSLFLGFLCSLLIIMLGEADPRWLLGAMVMFSLPVLDTALAFARRWTAGRPLFSADKQHIHHQLIARGLSVKQAVLIMYGLALFFVALGMTLIFLHVRYAVALYLVVFGCIIVAAYKMGMVHEKHRVKPHDVPTGDIGALLAGEPALNGAAIEPETRPARLPLEAEETEEAPT